MKFELSASVEKVINMTIEARNDEEAIEKMKDILMNGKEDFATILDVSVAE